MSGFPTTFHLGPLAFHTYGLGLAVAAYVAYLYAERRLRRREIDLRRFGAFTGLLIVAGLVGARAAHVATNWSLYAAHPSRIFAVWQGGLASFGGIAVALLVGVLAERRWWPEVALLRFSDALLPALVAGWALGRVLGPQFMYQGGGHLTHQWFGLHYSGQVGKRVPVPLLQGLEDGTLWLALVALERRGARRVTGLITGVAMVIWGAVRALDERLLLGQNSHSGSIGVQVAGVVMSVAGLVILAVTVQRRRARERAFSR